MAFSALSYTEILNDVYNPSTHALNTSTGNTSSQGIPIVPGQPTVAALSSITLAASGSGANTIITGVSAQTIRVFRVFMVAASAVDITIKDGNTALTGPMSIAANGGLVLDVTGEPWFVTSSGQNFVMFLSAAVPVCGRIYYTQS